MPKRPPPPSPPRARPRPRASSPSTTPPKSTSTAPRSPATSNAPPAPTRASTSMPLRVRHPGPVRSRRIRGRCAVRAGRGLRTRKPDHQPRRHRGDRQRRSHPRPRRRAPPTTCASPPPTPAAPTPKRPPPSPPRIPPSLTVDPPTVGYTTADVSGTVNPEGGPRRTAPRLRNWYSNTSTEPGNPDSWINSNVSSGRNARADRARRPRFRSAATIKGLKPGTTYSVPSLRASMTATST